MTAYVALTRDGTPWEPNYLDSVNEATCIGCGRCFKVCNQNVMELIGITEDGDKVDADDDEAIRKVTTVANPGNCIGCGACGKVCAKNAQTFVSAAVLAQAA